MANGAVVRSEVVRIRKTATFGDVAIVASVTFCSVSHEHGDSQKTQKNQASASHIEIVIVRMLRGNPTASIEADYDYY